jgi:hypothetical protein
MSNEDSELPEIHMTLDEAPDPKYTAEMHVGYDATGRIVRFTPYHVTRTRVAELADQMRSGQWRLTQLDESSAKAAGLDYAHRWQDPTLVGREQALQMLHQAMAIARARGWLVHARKSDLPDGFPSAEPTPDVRRPVGGGKSAGVGALLAAYVQAGQVPYHLKVADPAKWTTQKARPEDLVARIDQVIAEAEALAASVRSAQRNRDDLRRMFGDQR